MPSVPVRPTSKDEAEEGLWSSMLNSVATGKRLPEKTLVVLGPLMTGLDAVSMAKKA